MSVLWPSKWWHNRRQASQEQLSAALNSLAEAERCLQHTLGIRKAVRAAQPAIDRDISWMQERRQVNHLGDALMEAFSRKKDENDDSDAPAPQA